MCPRTEQLDLSANYIFSSSFNDPSVYKRGSCPTNIWRLLIKLNACQISLDKMSVVYITEKNLNVYLDQGRDGADTWFFHVVLSVDDKIYDLDYTDSPKVLDKADYFQRALSSSQLDNWEKISLRIIPASLYLDKYNPDNTAEYGFYYWLFPERSHFLEKTVPDFIDN